MAEEIVRNIGEGKIAIDTVNVTTATYELNFLLGQKLQLENELAKVNELIAKIETVKDKEIQSESLKLSEII